MVKKNMFNALTFMLGGAIGSIATFYIAKKKYEVIIEDKMDEINFLRDRYSSQRSEAVEQISDIENISSTSALELDHKSNIKNNEKENNMMIKPCIIPPGESWEQDYPTISLTYYEEDGVLADENNKIIDNVEELVPEDFADHFGEYEDDSVYVRNDEFGAYYEILRDYGSYAESD